MPADAGWIAWSDAFDAIGDAKRIDRGRRRVSSTELRDSIRPQLRRGIGVNGIRTPCISCGRQADPSAARALGHDPDHCSVLSTGADLCDVDDRARSSRRARSIGRREGTASLRRGGSVVVGDPLNSWLENSPSMTARTRPPVPRIPVCGRRIRATMRYSLFTCSHRSERSDRGHSGVLARRPMQNATASRWRKPSRPSSASRAAPLSAVVRRMRTLSSSARR